MLLPYITKRHHAIHNCHAPVIRVFEHVRAMSVRNDIEHTTLIQTHLCHIMPQTLGKRQHKRGRKATHDGKEAK
jgi:hypothetical protein